MVVDPIRTSWLDRASKSAGEIFEGVRVVSCETFEDGASCEAVCCKTVENDASEAHLLPN